MKWVENDSTRFDPLEQVMLNNRLRDAVMRGDDPLIVRQIIDQGAQVNPHSQHHDGTQLLTTPLLHVAARMDRPTVVEVLAGADREHLDIRDMFGRNALHVAALEDSRTATHVLLQMGLDPRAEDKLGFTPVDLAQARGNDAVLNIMRAGNPDIALREDVDQLRAEVAAAYPQSERSHVKQVRQRKDGPQLPNIPIR